jgi:hypothetical protein
MAHGQFFFLMSDVVAGLHKTLLVNVGQLSPSSQALSSLSPPPPMTGAKPELRIDSAPSFRSLLLELEMDAIDF